MIRVTTNGTLRGYRSSLMRSTNNLNAARDKVLSQRNFNSFAEDPTAATQAFKLRRSFSRVDDQLSNNKNLTKRYQSAWDALSTVKSDLVEKEGKVSTLAALSSPTASGRQPLAQVLKGAAESIVQTMNAQYGSEFVFAGNDSLDGAPFAWKDGELIYRGVKVDAADGTNDLTKLEAMNGEANYVDVGAGLTETNGTVLSTSAFNGALSGIEYLGYGLDEDGDPKNVASIMMELSGIFSRCDADSGDYADSKDAEDAERLAGKLNDALNEVINKWTQLDAKASYLEDNEDRLSTMANELNEQILEIEQVDMADAITEFSWAQYCYNAALKVGNSILSQSLIDYMS